MTTDPRAALNTLISALERHFEACSAAHGADDSVVSAAADNLVEAFEAYDDTLLASFGELTPLEVYSDEDDEFDEEDDIDDDDVEGEVVEVDDDFSDDDDDEDDNQIYSGFDGDFDVEN